MTDTRAAVAGPLTSGVVDVIDRVPTPSAAAASDAPPAEKYGSGPRAPADGGGRSVRDSRMDD